jgi:hypothetical protein
MEGIFANNFTMSVRAKFVVQGITITKDDTSWHYATGNSEPMDVYSVTLYPVTGGGDENKEFFASTPNGKIELNILNEEAAQAFKKGKEYYVDFTPAEK